MTKIKTSLTENEIAEIEEDLFFATDNEIKGFLQQANKERITTKDYMLRDDFEPKANLDVIRANLIEEQRMVSANRILNARQKERMHDDTRARQSHVHHLNHMPKAA